MVTPFASRYHQNFLGGLDHAEQVKRAEKFAIVILSFEITTGQRLFPSLSDEEVQECFVRAEFRDDGGQSPNMTFTFRGWSPAFQQELAKRSESADVP